MIARVSLNHIGIAVSDLSGMRKLFSLLGIEEARTEAVPDQGVITHFLPLPRAGQGVDQGVQTSLELLEVTDPEGVVAQFIRKRGPGIHHLSFLVQKGELDPLCARLCKEGYRLVYDAPRAGAHGMRISFIHPASAGGVLIELMESAK